jgi:hypothetical protein
LDNVFALTAATSTSVNGREDYEGPQHYQEDTIDPDRWLDRFGAQLPSQPAT